MRLYSMPIYTSVQRLLGPRAWTPRSRSFSDRFLGGVRRGFWVQLVQEPAWLWSVVCFTQVG